MVHVFLSSKVTLNLNVSFLTLSRYLNANNFYMVVFMNRSPFGAGLNLVINQPLWQSHYLAENLDCSKFSSSTLTRLMDQGKSLYLIYYNGAASTLTI
jgi:hypothetical protein